MRQGSSGAVEPVGPAVTAARALARLARFAERTLGDLSLAHYRVLSAIASGDERASRVAAKLSLGKPSVSAAVDALSRRGLVSRSVVDSDQRATRLALTAEGWAVLDRADRLLARGLEELCGAAGDAQQLIDALATLGGMLEDRSLARTG